MAITSSVSLCFALNSLRTINPSFHLINLKTIQQKR
nr:MAG TPA: hypothetical protein [Caudoviricetes sp.]